MSEIKVRDADYADVFADIHGRCFSKAWNESMMRQTLLLSGAIGLIAYRDEKPAGMAVYACSPEQADIVTFGVVPDYRGQKVSDELMDASFAVLAARGVKELFLEVAVDNPHAIGLYQRHGFTLVGRREGYYKRGDGTTDAFVMRADL